MLPRSHCFAPRVPAWVFVSALVAGMAACGGGGGGDAGGGTAALATDPGGSAPTTDSVVDSAPDVSVPNLAEGAASAVPDEAVADATPAASTLPAPVATPTVPSVLPLAAQAVGGRLGGGYGVDTCPCSGPY